jgi:hypothetical protein
MGKRPRYNRILKGGIGANPREDYVQPLPYQLTDDGIETFESDIGAIQTDLDKVRQPLVARLQEMLKELDGTTGESFEVNQRIAVLLQRTADQLGVAFCCPKEGCGAPSKIRCKNAPRSRAGAFVFEHYQDGKKVFHASSNNLPSLQLTRPTSTDSAS